MSVWDNFGKLNKLNIEFKENASAKNAVIYANGNNQVAISIKVDISAKNGKPLILSDEELLKVAYIVNYEDGKKLNKKGDDDKAWYYTDENFGYDTVSYDTVRRYLNNYLKKDVVSSGYEQEVVFYLSTTATGSMSLSAGIDIPGVGEFNASKKGTETKNGPKGETGDVFKLLQYVGVEGYTPNKSVRVVRNTYSRKLRTVRKICELDDIIYSGENEYLNYRVTPIGGYDSGNSIAATFSRDLKFVSINFPENKANLDTVKFRDNILPNMIIGRGGEEFSAYFVFFNDIGVETGIEKGSYFLAKQDSTGYKYKYEIPAERFFASSENAINIHILKCRIDFPDVGKYDWKGTYQDTIINAIDNYGNSYDIRIRIDYSSEDLVSVSR